MKKYIKPTTLSAEMDLEDTILLVPSSTPLDDSEDKEIEDPTEIDAKGLSSKNLWDTEW